MCAQIVGGVEGVDTHFFLPLLSLLIGPHNHSGQSSQTQPHTRQPQQDLSGHAFP